MLRTSLTEHFRRMFHLPLGFRKRDLAFAVRNAITRSHPLQVKINDVRFQMLPRGSVALWIWLYHSFEDAEIKFVLGNLKPGSVFLDVGSNSGYFALAAGKKLELLGTGKVYAFEPCYWTYDVLKTNILLNRLKNIYPCRLALANYNGESILHINAPGRDGLNTIGRPVHPESQVINSELVPAAKLDTFVEEHHLNHIDLMKIDCEGAELLVLQGAQALLCRADGPLILYENAGWTTGFDYQPPEITRFLHDHGYRLFVLDSQATIRPIASHPAGQDFTGTVIAVKPSHPVFDTMPA